MSTELALQIVGSNVEIVGRAHVHLNHDRHLETLKLRCPVELAL